MGAISLLRELAKQSREFLEGTMQDVTTEQAHRLPPGKAMPIGAHYAHVVIEQDAFINGVLRGGTPLFANAWAGRVGVSELQPMPGPGASSIPSWDKWARQVRVDLPALRQYAQAVYAASDEYVASLTEDDFSRTIDLSNIGLGQVTVSSLLEGSLLGNVFTHCGEISCLKGLEGAKGYPI